MEKGERGGRERMGGRGYAVRMGESVGLGECRSVDPRVLGPPGERIRYPSLHVDFARRKERVLLRWLVD